MSTRDSLKMLYQECLNLDLDETTQLILETANEEEQEFYSLIYDFILQQRQKMVIKDNLF
ncbi:hypothetical protein K413DRAFT_4631 [Clostridium sp. ASBs410]|nr:hypothetical protein K413DRAFT_4631 [Clostridium sp. ASBs410]